MRTSTSMRLPTSESPLVTISHMLILSTGRRVLVETSAPESGFEQRGVIAQATTIRHFRPRRCTSRLTSPPTREVPTDVSRTKRGGPFPGIERTSRRAAHFQEIGDILKPEPVNNCRMSPFTLISLASRIRIARSSGSASRHVSICRASDSRTLSSSSSSERGIHEQGYRA